MRPDDREVIRSSKQTAIRYERERPGELVHMDVKQLGKIPTGGGGKAHGHTRLASPTSRSLPDEKGSTCAAFLERAAAYFAATGVDRIERVTTNNAFAYRYPADVQKACADLGAIRKFIRPHWLWQNAR